MSKVIQLYTDFGYRDTSVGEMKAVMHRINPAAAPIDMTHELEDIMQGAYMLETRVCNNTPMPFAAVAVVDPGVGTDRRALAIKTKAGCYLIGPDNGILVPAARRLEVSDIRSITNASFFNPDYKGILPDKLTPERTAVSSDIFHGRDVFAPTAAHLSKSPESFGKVGEEMLTLDQLVAAPYGPITEEDTFPIGVKIYSGFIPFIDTFGNVFTNIPLPDGLADMLRERDRVRVKIDIFRNDAGRTSVGSGWADFKRSFGAVEEGSPVCVDDSYGYYNIALNQGNFAEEHGVQVGDGIEIRLNPITLS